MKLDYLMSNEYVLEQIRTLHIQAQELMDANQLRQAQQCLDSSHELHQWLTKRIQMHQTL